MSQRLGIFGGMFDPVHKGHLAAARQVHATLGLETLRMVPCAIPNHRGPASAGGRHRLRMLELACADIPGLVVDPIELERQGVSYTVDTLQFYRDQYPSALLFLLLGVDAFLGLPHWHQWQRLLALCHLFVLSRPGYRIDPEISALIEFEQRRVDRVDALFDTPAGQYYMADGFEQPESSTAIRESLKAGRDVSNSLDARVLQYIRENALYQYGKTRQTE